ncbi:VOC family protein [Streptomyces anulatus]|uniref:VOC family protein n=1 Tax=Streptomyces anulatus TaxID=1892 RepID=UPI001C257E70|nr:VOC family protein [Streptomyces anulatus]
MADGQRFAFTKIAVKNLDAQSAFYSAALGQIVRHRVSGGEGDGAFSEVVMGSPDGDGPSLLLVHHLQRETPTPGEVVLGFTVADVERVVRAVADAGGVVCAPPRSLPGQAVRVARVQDPEGHALEIVQPT